MIILSVHIYKKLNTAVAIVGKSSIENSIWAVMNNHVHQIQVKSEMMYPDFYLQILDK